MAKRTHEAWARHLNANDRELTLEEFAAMELTHLCAHLAEVARFTNLTHLATSRADGRLDRLELWLARNADYPTTQTQMPDLAALRASGIPE